MCRGRGYGADLHLLLAEGGGGVVWGVISGGTMSKRIRKLCKQFTNYVTGLKYVNNYFNKTTINHLIILLISNQRLALSNNNNGDPVAQQVAWPPQSNSNRLFI